MENRKIIENIIRQMTEFVDGKLWMGDNFDQKITSINEEEAFMQPPNMHSVAQLLAHLTAWNKDGIHKIIHKKGYMQDHHEENWPDNEQLKSKRWPVIMKEFRDHHDQLVELLRQKEDDFLEEVYYDQGYKGEFAYSFLIEGLLQHHFYHLGQMGLVIKIIKLKN